jgi:transporter family-2 protein
MKTILILFAALLGLSAALQGTVNGLLAQRLSLPATVLLNACVVVVLAFVWWLLSPGERTFVPSAPTAWYLFTGGLFGVAILVSAAVAFPRLGAGPTTAIAVAAQLTAALALDHLGWAGVRLGVTPARVLGAVLLLVGAMLVLGTFSGARE